jgi:hypothetical protein
MYRSFGIRLYCFPLLLLLQLTDEYNKKIIKDLFSTFIEINSVKLIFHYNLLRTGKQRCMQIFQSLR